MVAGGMAGEEMLTPKEVRVKLGISKRTLYRWIKTGKIKAVVLPSGRIRIPREEVEKILRAAPSGGE
jgi:excisionase family DNA binding protein